MYATESNSVLETKPQNQVVAVMFTEGWKIFEDLAILVGRGAATLALQRCIDYCGYNLQTYVAQLEKISHLGDLNPNDLEGIEENIMRLGAEVFYCAHHNRLFEVGTVRELPYMFYHVGPHRLYLQRLL